MIPLANGAILAGIQINNLFIPKLFSRIEYMRKIASYESDKRKPLPANGSRKSFKSDDDCSLRGVVVLFVPHYSHFSRSRMRQNTNRPPFSLPSLVPFLYHLILSSLIWGFVDCAFTLWWRVIYFASRIGIMPGSRCCQHISRHSVQRKLIEDRCESKLSWNLGY